MQVGIDVTCMHTKFGGCGLSGFGDIVSVLFASKQPKLPIGPWTIVHGGQKIELAQKIHASRG